MSPYAPSHPPPHLRLVDALPSAEAALTIDCDTCVAQFTDVCADCLVSYVIGHEAGTPVMLDEEEKRAVDLLAAAGLIPPSRHCTGHEVA